ncbi:hypothetical protein BG011_000941 [Mortierella polycephala]|uniref:Uncharacterized protein n=1 Tax=Mortierella polycephala TaxID=41804 RepID=A0A9P6U6R1_9FUNG|nr:hypothetical protein BG011_000941 [Mortierella polycephala]
MSSQGLTTKEQTNAHRRTSETEDDELDTPMTEQTPSYSDILPHVDRDLVTPTQLSGDRELSNMDGAEPPYPIYRAMSSSDIVVVSTQQQHGQSPPPQHQHQQRQKRQQQQQIPNISSSYTTPSGLKAALELESDTVEIYDRSNDGFQYSLKGSVEIDWIGDKEVVLKDARIDFVGYADTAVLRYEAGDPTPTATETPVHHIHDFIPTPLVLSSTIAPASSMDTSSATSPQPAIEAGTTIAVLESGAGTPSTSATPRHHHESLAIDLTLPGHLPDTTNLSIGKIRYELQVSLELTFAPGTNLAVTESIILRRPVLIHRIVYPSAHLQPRIAMGLDSGGVEIQVKVPRLLHCENTLLAVELYAKPRTRNVRLHKAKVVFEQIETDRYHRTSALPLVAIPKAVIPLASTVATSPPLTPTSLATAAPAGPPPAPRLLTRKIAQPLEVNFDEPTSELQSQSLHLQLVLSPDLSVDVQSNWLQISHTLRIEIEYSTDEEDYITAPPSAAPPALQDATKEVTSDASKISPKTDVESEAIKPGQEQQLGVETDAASDQKLDALWEQEGDAIETDSQAGDRDLDGDWQSKYILDEKALQDGEGSGSSTVPSNHYHQMIPTYDTPLSQSLSPPPLPARPNHVSHPSTLSVTSGSSSYTYSVATEEIPLRVVRVVSTALVDASTIAQAAGETEAGLPTYESVIEATGLPAYAEEKPDDDHEGAEASGTANGVLGGAARRLEGDDAELQRR